MDVNDTLYTIPVTTIDGSRTTLQAYKGRVLLIVNVASKCGFTPQYKELEALQQNFQGRGFSVLGFPCDQFLHQEPGSDAEIQAFVTNCFRVTFPLFSKIDVKGPNQAPLYAWLKTHLKKRPLIFIPWNFTKILVDAHGQVIQHYLPTTSFKKISKAIEALL